MATNSIPAWVAALHGHARSLTNEQTDHPMGLHGGNAMRITEHCTCGWFKFIEYVDYTPHMDYWTDHVVYEIAISTRKDAVENI